MCKKFCDNDCLLFYIIALFVCFTELLREARILQTKAEAELRKCKGKGVYTQVSYNSKEMVDSYCGIFIVCGRSMFVDFMGHFYPYIPTNLVTKI